MKRLISCALALAMLLIACQGAMAGEFKMDTTVTVTTAKNVYDINIYPEGQTPDDNVLYDAIEEVMGIRFVNAFSVPFDAYKQQITLGIVSRDLPDMFTADEQDLAELIKNDMLEDLTPYYEEYASDNLRAVMNFNNGSALAPSMRNGRLYGMPNMSDAMNSVPVLWIRADWLDALNREVPTTADEFIELAIAFAEEDPDGNNIKDTYGIGLNNELDMRFTSFANMFGAYPRIYKLDGGTFSYGSVDPATKEALSQLRALYEAGAIDPEFATKDMSKMMETVSQGKIGMLIGEFFSPLWPLVDTINLVEGSEWIGVPMPGEDYAPHVKINAMGAHVVRKGAEHPEALIIYLNNVVEAGHENPENEWSNRYAELSAEYVNNSFNNWMPMLFDLPNANASKLEKYKIVDETGDISILAPSQRNLYELIQAAKQGDKTQWAWPKTYYEGVETALSYDKMVFDAWYLPPTNTAKLTGATLLTMELTAFINIIAGNAPLDDFDKFCDEWMEQGGSKVLEEMAELYEG